VTQRGLYDRSVHDLLGHLKNADPASPDTFVRRSLLRTDINSIAGVTVPTTGKLLVVPVVLEAGDLVTSVGFVTGTTAAASPTSGFVALYNSAGTLVGSQSADFTSTAMGASATFTKALGAAYRVPTPGVYYVGWCVAAATMPTLLGTPVAPAIATGEASYARESTSATYTTTAPTTLPAMTARLECPYFELI
jgi:hypothetical protein